MNAWLKGKSWLVSLGTILVMFTYLLMIGDISNHTRAFWNLILSGLSYLTARSYKLEMEGGANGTKKFSYRIWMFNTVVWLVSSLIWLF